MKKQIGKNLMQKWKNKIRVRLSALDKKKLVLTNIPYILTAFYTNRASFQKQSGRRYWEQAIICDGTCRQDSYWIAAKF